MPPTLHPRRKLNLSRVAEGPLKGKTIGELMSQSPEDFIGSLAGHYKRFPLLLKFLDVRERLSVQVHHCLRSRHYVNVVVAGKHALPQWLSMDAAVVHCTEGVGIWQWASNDQNAEPDVVMACCGDTPTLEILAAVSILREHLPDLKIRVINVVDLMKLQSASEHPHGLSEADYDSIFTKDKHIVFGFHGYPWLVHRLTYRRTNRNLHVRGYKEEGTITTAFDIRVQNELDRFHLVQDVVDRVPNLGTKGAYLKQMMRDKLYDWNRIDAKTHQKRPLQIDQAMACINFSQGAIVPVIPQAQEVFPVLREKLIHCDHFGIWRI